MPEPVSRHPVDAEYARRQAEAVGPQAQMFLRYVGKKTEALTSVHSWALSDVRYRCVADPSGRDPETWRALRLAGQAAVATFVAAETGEPEFDAEVGGPVRIKATGPTSQANAGHWLVAAWLALIARDEAAIGRLCDVSLETLRASGARHSAYMYPWVESVGAFLRREPVPPEMFKPAMDGTDPDKPGPTPRDVMLELVYPPIEMFYRLLQRDAEKFNASLEKAVARHRDHWSAEPERADDPEGFIALAPLGVAVLARSARIPVEVRSDYLPAAFLAGPGA